MSIFQNVIVVDTYESSFNLRFCKLLKFWARTEPRIQELGNLKASLERDKFFPV